MGTENNGYLDSDQTIINYGVREQRISFAELIEQDPSYMLRKWLKLRKGAQSTSIGCALAGAGGVVLGVWTGAIPLMVAGMGVSALSGYMIKHHSEGAQAIATEASILDQCRPILHLLAQLEQRGANPSDLVSLYDRIIRAAIAQRLDAGEPEQLKEFFQREIQQSNVVSSLLGGQEDRGIASTPVSRQQPQAIGNDTRLGAVDVPAIAPGQNEPAAEDAWWDSSPAPAAATAQPDMDGDRYNWVKDLLHFPAILVWGAQGSGKTSFASWLLRERIKAGHSAEVWDVHREYGQWNGLPVFGDGMNYDAVDARMLAFERTVKADYQERATNPSYNPRRHTVICEEFTNFARRCENAAPFFEASLSDLRKVKKGVIFVSHGRTLTAVGGSKGFGKTRDNGLLELELQARIDPATGDPVPALKGKLKIPGREAIAVDIATWMNGAMDFTGLTQAAPLPAAETRPATPAAAPTPAVEETHSAVSEAGVLAGEALKRIGAKIAEKFASSGGDWLPRAAVSRDLFNNTDDRNSAKELIDRLIAAGKLEVEERANTNGSTTTFVRVSRNLSF